jgi:hypothetical protein
MAVPEDTRAMALQVRTLALEVQDMPLADLKALARRVVLSIPMPPVPRATLSAMTEAEWDALFSLGFAGALQKTRELFHATDAAMGDN